MNKSTKIKSWEWMFWIVIFSLLAYGCYRFWIWGDHSQVLNDCLKNEIAIPFCARSGGTVKYSSYIEQSFTCIVDRQNFKLEYLPDEISYCEDKTVGVES